MCPPYTETSLRSNPGYSSRNADNVFIFCCPAQWISSVFPLTTDVSAPIRSSRLITYLLASSLPLASPPSHHLHSGLLKQAMLLFHAEGFSESLLIND